MRFSCGTTRFVILTSKYAIKIARPRPIHALVRLVQTFQQKKAKRELDKYSSNWLVAGLKYLAAGVVANRNEYRLYQKYGDQFLVPTISLFLGGVINVQLRGRTAALTDAYRHPLWHMAISGYIGEYLHPEQYCVIGTKVYLVDYGQNSFETILRALCSS